MDKSRWGRKDVEKGIMNGSHANPSCFPIKGSDSDILWVSPSSVLEIYYFVQKSYKKIKRMQAIKEKLNDMSTMRKVKAEAKADEQAEKELAKTRLDVAHEVRKAREAEAQMDLHVAKAAQRIDKEIMKRTDQLGAEPMVAVTDDRQGYRSVTADGDLNQGYTGGTHTNNMTNMAGADPNPNFL